MTEAKAAILASIREALAGSGELPYDEIERSYRQRSDAQLESRLTLFEHRLRDYGSDVYRCGENEVRDTIGRALADRHKTSLLIPTGFPNEWLPSNVVFEQDSHLSYNDLNESEGVLTTCAVAIAETGTIILRHSEEEGRRALTLIPDYHLCVVHAKQIVATVVEGIRLAGLFASEPITTISGPSATSDIEMTRVKGVHGPRILDVVLIVSPS